MKRSEILIPRHYFGLPKWFASASNIKPAAKIVMMALIDYLGQGKDYCYPSIRRLSEDTGIDERTVQRALKSLAANGHIRIESGSRNTSNRYFIHPMPNAVQAVRSYETCGKSVTPTENEVEGGNLSGGCGKSVTPRGGKMSTELPESLTTERTTVYASREKVSLFSIFETAYEKRKGRKYLKVNSDHGTIRTADSQQASVNLDDFKAMVTEYLREVRWENRKLTHSFNHFWNYARPLYEQGIKERESLTVEMPDGSIRFRGRPGEFDGPNPEPVQQPDYEWLEQQAILHAAEQEAQAKPVKVPAPAPEHEPITVEQYMQQMPNSTPESAAEAVARINKGMTKRR